jgi:hypothetical protein
MSFGRAGEAADNQPCQRQRDGQQHPASHPAKEKYPHVRSLLPPAKRLCRGRHVSSPAGGRIGQRHGQLPARHAALFPEALPPVGRCKHHDDEPDGTAGHRLAADMEVIARRQPGAGADERHLAFSAQAGR